DTNGYDPDKLKDLLDSGLVDYVAMDVKNKPQCYAETAGLQDNAFRYENIVRSLEILKQSGVEYELRTTVVKEFHNPEKLKELAQQIHWAKRYVLQQFEPGENTIQPGFHAFSAEELKAVQEEVRTIIPDTELRGIVE
ncbi:MAG: anaerobic ribonucleoside-triphosphate reductase activating protein, partial [Solobacterium sp.]|nr:anaerobic ribonucleoside-triphosphate reductase activating protein [Solobacterium sp.]